MFRFILSDDQLYKKVMKYFYYIKSHFSPALKDSVDLAAFELLTYLVDGWLFKGYLWVIGGSYCSGETYYSIYRAYKFERGESNYDVNALLK